MRSVTVFGRSPPVDVHPGPAPGTRTMTPNGAFDRSDGTLSMPETRLPPNVAKETS